MLVRLASLAYLTRRITFASTFWIFKDRFVPTERKTSVSALLSKNPLSLFYFSPFDEVTARRSIVCKLHSNQSDSWFLVVFILPQNHDITMHRIVHQFRVRLSEKIYRIRRLSLSLVLFIYFFSLFYLSFDFNSQGFYFL